MKNKILTLLGIFFLSIFVISGCATNDGDPPPEDDIVDENGRTNGSDNDMDNGVGDDTGNDNNIIEGDGLNDENRDGDGDMMRDNNTPEEDIIEDADDAADRDNVDR